MNPARFLPSGSEPVLITYDPEVEAAVRQWASSLGKPSVSIVAGSPSKMEKYKSYVWLDFSPGFFRVVKSMLAAVGCQRFPWTP